MDKAGSRDTMLEDVKSSPDSRSTNGLSADELISVSNCVLVQAHTSYAAPCICVMLRKLSGSCRNRAWSARCRRLPVTTKAARRLLLVRPQTTAKTFERRRGGQVECFEQPLSFRQYQRAGTQGEAVIVDQRYRFFRSQIEPRGQYGRPVIQ